MLVALLTVRLYPLGNIPGTHLLEAESTPGPECGRKTSKYLPYGFVKMKKESYPEINAFLVILVLGMNVVIFRMHLFSEISDLPNTAIFMCSCWRSTSLRW